MKLRARLILPLLLVSCRFATVPSSIAHPARLAAAPLPVQRVVLITVDGVRWQEIFRGVDPVLARKAGLSSELLADGRALLPNLYALIDRGVALGDASAGSPMVASGPNFVSLPGYREIFTGRSAGACIDNDCEPLDQPTVLDELRDAGGLPPGDIAAITSWETLKNAVSQTPSRMAISSGRKSGATRDQLRVSPAAAALLDACASAKAWPGKEDYRPDRCTATLALEYLTARRPRFLYVGLGDTDELGHRNDYRAYLGALRAFDQFLGRVVEQVDAQTIVLVTCDHGRAATFQDHGRAVPESASVWLVAAGAHIPARGRVALASSRRLADIAPTLRALLTLDPDHTPGAGVPIPELLPAPLVARR